MSKIQATQSVLAELLETVRQSLAGNRMGEAYRAISQGKISMKARETLRSLADFVGRKENELQRASQLNRFYRNCIQMLVDQQQIGVFIQKQFKDIHEGCRDLLTDLQDFVKSIKQNIVQKEEQCHTLSQRLAQQQKRVLLLEREMQQSIQTQRQNAQNRIMILKNEAEIVKNQLKQQLTRKQQELAASNKRIVQQKQLKQSFQKRYHAIQAQIQKMLQISASVSNQSERMSQSLREQNEFLRNKNKDLQESLEIIKAQSIILQQNIIFSVNNKHDLPLALSSAIKNEVGKEVKSVQKLYSFKQQRNHNFHENIDKRNNILLVCLTIQGQIIGAFTTARFDISSDISQKTTKAFLFGMHNDCISVNLLKKNRQSIIYDWDFLIFGNQQICIEKGKNTLTSYTASACDKILHFQRSLKKDYFLDAVKQGKVQLKNYEIFQVEFQY